MGWKQGSLIMEAQPYVHVICQKFKEERCNFCLKSQDHLKRCASCQKIWYCSRTCQRGDWKLHKTECSIMKRVPHRPTDSICLYLRLVIRHLAGASTVKDTDAEFPCIRSFNDLMSHSESIRTDGTRWEQYQLASDFLRAYTHGILELPGEETMLDIFGKMVINAFNVTDEMLQGVAVAVYTSPSVLDHRCCPNAVASFDGRRVMIRAVADIPSGSLSDVYLSYVVVASTKERQRQLKEQYYFTCTCDQCRNTQMDAKMTSEKGSKKGDLDKVKACMKRIKEMDRDQDDPVEALRLCEACLDEVTLPPLNVDLVKLRGEAFELAIQAQNWEAALRHGDVYLEPHTTLSHPFAPSVGYVHAKLAKILILTEKLREALPHLAKAEENFAISLGRSHFLYGEVKVMMEQCEAELAFNDAP